MRRFPGRLIVLLLGGLALAQSAGPDPASIDEAIQGLHSKYYDERKDAKDKLIRMGAPVMPRVIQALKDDDYRARQAACEILGALARPEAIDPLIGVLSDGDEGVRKAAVEAITQFGDTGRAALAKAREANPAVAPAIDEALAQFSRVQIERILDTRITSKGGYGFYKDQFAPVLALGKPAVDTLMEMFLNPDYEFQVEKDQRRQETLRVLAGEALGDSNDTSIVPKLKEFMTRAEDNVGQLPRFMDPAKEAARYALFRLGEKSFMEEKKAAVLEAIAKGGDQAAIVYRAQLAEVYVRMGDLGNAEKEYQKFVAQQPKNHTALYNLSCIYSLEGKKAESLRTLREAVQEGFVDAEWLRLDGDLNNIRGEEGYKAIIRDLPPDDQQKDGVQMPEPPKPTPPKKGDDEGSRPH